MEAKRRESGLSSPAVNTGTPALAALSVALASAAEPDTSELSASTTRQSTTPERTRSSVCSAWVAAPPLSALTSRGCGFSVLAGSPSQLSSSSIVAVAKASGRASSALRGLLSRTRNVSSDSGEESLIVITVKLAVVCPGMKVSVPLFDA